MPEPLPSNCLVLALADTQELVYTDVQGRELRRLGASGYPRFPAARPGGGLAYLAITSAPPPWQVVLAVLDGFGEIVDLIPEAAVFAPPAWSRDGTRLLYLRGDSGAAELVEWTLADGGEQVRKADEALRSAVWDPDGALIWSSGGAIHAEHRPEPLAAVAAAAGLHDFGSDDLYATVDQVAVSRQGSLAAVERWYRQGVAPQEHVVLVREGRLERQTTGRYPRWTPDGGILCTLEDGRVQLPQELRVLEREAAHSAEWVAREDQG